VEAVYQVRLAEAAGLVDLFLDLQIYLHHRLLLWAAAAAEQDQILH